MNLEESHQDQSIRSNTTTNYHITSDIRHPSIYNVFSYFEGGKRNIFLEFKMTSISQRQKKKCKNVHLTFNVTWYIQSNVSDLKKCMSIKRLLSWVFPQHQEDWEYQMRNILTIMRLLIRAEIKTIVKLLAPPHFCR